MKISLASSLRLVLIILISLITKKVQAQTAVGSIQGSGSVTSSGAFSYNVPLVLPPGINKMMPEISVTYNNQNRGGMLGRGWDISGLSSITRTTTTIYHNANIDPVDFDGNDVFLLDGQRLIVTSKSGNGNYEYVTENKNFSKITSTGLQGTGPAQFTVTTKEGVVYEYGATTDSRMLANGKQDVMIWALNRVYDANGNYIEFSYYNDPTWGEYRIAFIRYTGNFNAGSTPPTEIAFNYEYKNDKNVLWVNGSRVQDVWRISNIVINHNGQMVHKYAFKYGYFSSDFYSHLSSITENGENGEVLPETKIDWGWGNPSYTGIGARLVPTNTTNPSYYTLFSCGDFNGDGYTDIVNIPNTGPSGGSYQFYANNENEGFQASPQQSLPAYVNAQTTTTANLSSKLTFDWDGNGYDDIVVVTTDQNMSSVKITVLLSSGNGTFGAPSVVYSYSGSSGILNEFKWIPGDFDGDGRREIMVMIPQYPSGTLTGYNCSLVGSVYSGIPGNNVFLSPIKTAIPMDYDGDGKDELFVTYKNANPTGSSFLSLSGIQYDLQTRTPYIPGSLSFIDLGSSGYPTEWHNIFNGDFNGDGKKDLLTWSNYQGGIWEIAYSKGNGLDVMNASFLRNTDPSYNNDNNYIVADFNGDGKDDILEMYIDGSNNVYNLFYARGYGDFVKETYTLPTSDVTIAQNWLRVGDFDGDGQADLLIFENNTKLKLLFFNQNDRKEYVRSIDRGDGNIVRVDYSCPGQLNYSSATAQYPMNSFPIPIKVVNHLNVNGDITSYSYQGMKIHRTGLGMRGFNSVIAENANDQTISINNYNNYQYNTVVPRSSMVKDISGTTTLSMINYEFGQITTPLNNVDNLYIVYPTKTDEVNYKSGSRKETTFIYNYNGAIYPSLYEFGQPDAVQTSISGGQEIATTTYEYYAAVAGTPTINRYRPSKITTTNTRSGQPSYTRVQEFTFDAQGRPSNTISDNNTANTKVETLTYDVFGNIIMKELSGAGISLLRTENFAYTPDGRFLSKSTNALNQTNSFTYNIWGGVTSKTDANGLTTKTDFDGFCRQKQTTSPTGHYTAITKAWASGDADNPGYVGNDVASYLTIENTGGISGTTKQFFTADGRVLRTVKKGFNGESLYKDIGYLPNKNTDWTSDTYIQGSTPNKTFYQYDLFDRVIMVQSPTKTVTTQYVMQFVPGTPTGMKTTSTDVGTGQTKLTETDGAGRITKVTENGNSLVYVYNSIGEPDWVHVNTPGSASIHYLYDEFGRKKSALIPGMGTTTYKYDSFDQLISQTDANGATYNIEYDILGRPIHKMGPDGNYDFQYDNGANAVGKVVSETSPYNTQKILSYDQYSRVNSVTENVNGQSLATTYEYDIYNRVSKTRYPSGDEVRNVYNSYGYFAGVNLVQGQFPLNDYSLYQIKNKHPYGMVTNADYQPNSGILPPGSPGPAPPLFSIGNYFDAYGKPAQEMILQPSGNYMNLLSETEYNYDPATDNLIDRYDVKRGLHEKFSYDNLNRLIDIQQVVGTTMIPIQHIDYAFDGNMKSNANVSSDTWANQGHRVAYVTNPGANIPLATQTVSYTPFNMPNVINEDNHEARFTYNPDHERAMVDFYNGGAQTKTRYYTSNYERTVDASTGDVEEISYVWGQDAPVAMLVRKNGALTILYVVTDYLGSITHLIDASGNIVEERSFDAWGRMRDPNNWSYASVPSYSYDRGYCGHEYMSDFRVINMNARLYDPVVNRMFSADPEVSDPSNLQAYNRYSYAMNNPFKYSDPNGEFVIGAIIGGFVGAWTGYQIATNENKSGWDRIGYMVVGSVIGSSAAWGAGLASSYITSALLSSAATSSSGFIAGSISGFAGGMASGFANGFAFTGLQGGSFSDMINGGFNGALWGGLSGAIMGGVSGGLNAVAQRRNFWSGFVKADYAGKISALSPTNPVDRKDLPNFVEKHFGKYIANYSGFSRYKPIIQFDANNLVTDVGVDAGTAPIDGDWLKAGQPITLLNPNAYASELHLYLVIDHELVHAADIATGYRAFLEFTFGGERASALSELHAYSHGLQTTQTMNMPILERSYYSNIYSQWIKGMTEILTK